jgi:hypothetical protein
VLQDEEYGTIRVSLVESAPVLAPEEDEQALIELRFEAMLLVL